MPPLLKAHFEQLQRHASGLGLVAGTALRLSSTRALMPICPRPRASGRPIVAMFAPIVRDWARTRCFKSPVSLSVHAAR
jgi:hypothetical protein